MIYRLRLPLYLQLLRQPQHDEQYTRTRMLELRDHETRNRKDWARAAGIALAATMQSFVCTNETSHVGTNMAHRVLNSSTQENGRLAKQKRAGPPGAIELKGLTRVCLQLNCCRDSQSSCLYNRSFPSRPRFPVKHSVLCKYTTYHVTNLY